MLESSMFIVEYLPDTKFGNCTNYENCGECQVFENCIPLPEKICRISKVGGGPSEIPGVSQKTGPKRMININLNINKNFQSPAFSVLFRTKFPESIKKGKI